MALRVRGHVPEAIASLAPQDSARLAHRLAHRGAGPLQGRPISLAQAMGYLQAPAGAIARAAGAS
eukprot:1813-Alexandrium_andersonii.AAC.1